MNTENSWTLREILIVAAIGATFGFLYLGWVQVWLIGQALFGPVTMDVMMGFWFIASIVAAAIIRKPGAALLAEVLAALVEVLLGSPAGLLLILAGSWLSTGGWPAESTAYAPVCRSTTRWTAVANPSSQS